jgi:type IV secretory pathway VirB3-like protein
MTLDIDVALRNGFSRTFKRNGLLLFVAFAVFGLVSSVLVQTATLQLFERLGDLSTTPAGDTGTTGTAPPDVGNLTGTQLALPIPLPIAVPLAILTPFVGEALRIVAVRTLVSDHTTSIPGAFVRENIVWATLNGFIGGIVVYLIVLIGGVIGLIGLLIGGPIVAAFLATSFFFVRQEIAVENKNFVDALTDSWRLTSGHRIGLFALALAVWIVGLIASIPGTAIGIVAATGSLPVATLALTVVSIVVSALTTVFGIAVAARAYDQLRAERTGDESENGSATT